MLFERTNSALLKFSSSIGGAHTIRRLLTVAAIPVALAIRSTAAELTIANHSFEDPVLGEGEGFLSVPGWVHQGTVQIYNPNNSYFLNTTDGALGNPLDGRNLVGVNIGGNLSYEMAHLVTSDTAYSLTFLAGYRFGANIFGNSSVSLWAGTNRLAERFPNPPEGQILPFSLSYTSPPAGPMIGVPLRIELKPEGVNSQPWFDNFRLFADPFVCTPHKATATAQLFNGILVGVTITDSGCGYSNAPTVTIQGGGGNGATVTAVLAGDRVSAIQVNNGGCCYTNVPLVVIESPPRIPTVAIAVSKVRVTQNVTLGRRYVLESSVALTTWNPTGPAFTAASETIEGEFDVSITGHFFRLREVP